MRWAMLVLAMVAAEAMAADPIADAQAHFRTLESYRVTLRSRSADGEHQVIRYAYRKPGWIRMDFVEPHRGAVLIYDPRTRRVSLSPFGLEHLPTFHLDPDNRLIRSPRGHSVDQSDVGVLLANLAALRQRGRSAEPVPAEVAGRAAILLDIEGNAGVSVAGVHRYRVWLDRDAPFPLKVQSFAVDGAAIETVHMDDAAVNVDFPPNYFAP